MLAIAGDIIQRACCKLTQVADSDVGFIELRELSRYSLTDIFSDLRIFYGISYGLIVSIS